MYVVLPYYMIQKNRQRLYNSNEIFFLEFRQIYWGDWSKKNPRIERASMDGTNRTVIHNTKLKWPNALTVDLIGQRLYWADAWLDVIETSLLNGNYRQVVIGKIVNHPFSIAIFDKDIYYTDWNSGVYHVSRTTNNTIRILETALVTVMGIKTVHPSLQQPGRH